MKAIAQIISVVFHPIVQPIWLLMILLYYADQSLLLHQSGKKTILLTIFSVFTTILPVLNILILKFTGYLKEFEMNDKKERNLPFLICLVYYGGLFYLLVGSDIPLFYSAFIIASFVLILFNYLINLRWKISSHAIGAGGVCGALICFSLLHQREISFLIAGYFLMSGLVLTARLILHKHNQAQVYVGYVSGLILSIFIIPVSKIIILKILFT